MEKKIGIIAIFVTGKTEVSSVNSFLSDYSDLILARQGLPFREKGLSIISLIIEGNMNQINELSGKLGKLQGVNTKLVFPKAN